MQYRLARETDIPAMARIRAEGWGTREYWERRIAGYMSGDVHPHESLPQRVAYVAVDESQDDSMAGLVAGHLTHRLECDGELEWINVAQEHRTAGVGFQLMVMMARWFDWMNARRICVNVEPTNTVARNFYAGMGARMLDANWMVWDDIRTVRPG